MDTQLLIGAKEVPASGGKTFDRLNPLSGECATRATRRSSIPQLIELQKQGRFPYERMLEFYNMKDI